VALQRSNVLLETIRQAQSQFITATPYMRETRLKFPNGKIRWIRDIARPKREDSGAVVWDGIVFDISQSKIYEERLEQTNAELQRATQLKDDRCAPLPPPPPVNPLSFC
jgi:hypothetical protein